MTRIGTVLGMGRRLWRRYWRYVALSGGLFVLGAVLGGLLVDVVELSALLGMAGAPEGGFPEPTTGLLLANNLLAMVVLIASGLTLGLGTAVILVYNGFIVGYVVVLVARAEGPLFPVVGIVPHGVLEIPALLLAGAVAFRFSHQVLGAATGTRDDVMTSPELREAIVATVLAFALIPVAAYIEANVTTALLESYQ